MNSVHECLTDNIIHQLIECELDDNATATAEEHLSQCDRCRTAMESAMSQADWWRKARDSLVAQDDAHAAEDSEACSSDLLSLLGPTDHPQMLGRIDQYEVSGVIGRGGMGVVFKALDTSLNRFVAIKMLAPQLSAWGAARKRFAREGQAAAAVVDDYVLPIYGVNEWRGMPYLVTQYSRGTTLQRRIQNGGPLETKEITRIAMQAARGLAAAHAQGLVHRDVKPSNILLDGNVERAMLTDFGLARAVDDASITQTGIIAGTPQYMSPEQARGANVDARSDLFGLGCVMYAMCTGHPPFRGENSFAILKSIAEMEPQSIREINPEIPAWMCLVVSRLMAKSPDDRYASAAEVANLLGDCLAHLQQPTLKELPCSLKTTSPPWFRSTIVKAAFLMLGFVLFGILGLALAQSNPPEIDGDWVDQEWGNIHIAKTEDGKWSGRFTGTTAGTPGKITLAWSRISRRFNGKWEEGEKAPFGDLSIRVVDGQIRGAYSIDKQFITDATASQLADLAWNRSTEAEPDVLKRIPHLGRLFDNKQARDRIHSEESTTDKEAPSPASRAESETLSLLGQISKTSPPVWAIPSTNKIENHDQSPRFLNNDRILWGADIVDVKTGNRVATCDFRANMDIVSAMRLSQNRKFLVFRGETPIPQRSIPNRTGWVQVWDVERGGLFVGTHMRPDDENVDVDVTNDGQTVAMASRSGVTLWNTATGTKTKTLPVDLDDFPPGLKVFNPEFLRFSPDNKWLVAFSLNTGIYWQWQTDQKPRVISLGRRLQTFAFSPDSRFLAEGPDSRTNIQLRDVSSTDVLRTFFDEVDSPMITSGLTFTPDGKTLVASNSISLIESIKVPHRLHFWDVQTGTIKRQMATGQFVPGQLDISPDGKWLAVQLGDNKTTVLAVWPVEE